MNQNPCWISDLCGKRSAMNTKAHSVICNNNNLKKIKKCLRGKFIRAGAGMKEGNEAGWALGKE